MSASLQVDAKDFAVFIPVTAGLCCWPLMMMMMMIISMKHD